MSSPAPLPTSFSSRDAERDRLAIEAAGLGVWELDVATGTLQWNERMYALYQLPVRESPPGFDSWLSYVHPEDQQRVMEAYRQLLASPAPLTIEFRILTHGGEVRHLKSVTQGLQDRHGQASRLVGINEDVTRQAADRQQAVDSSRELEAFFDISLSLMCITTLEGRVLAVNQAWQHVLGRSEAELVGASFLEFVHPEDLAATLAIMGDLEEGRDVTGFINRYRHRNGGYRHIEWRSTTQEGLIYASAHDVSARIALERQLAEERNYLQLIIDSLPSPVFAKDWQGRHTLANRSVATLFGTTPEAMIGRTDAEMPLPPEIQEKFLRDDREVMVQGRPKTILEQPMPDQRGDIRWFQVVKVPLMAERPVEERQVLGIATDVTERERNEQRLKRQEALYRSLVESQQDLIVRVDTRNRFTFVNDAYCTAFGKSREELIGKTFTPLVHEDDLAHTLAAIERLTQYPHPRVTIVQRAMTQAGWRWLSWEDSAILDEAGTLVEIQGVGRDITDLKEAQQRAEASSRQKGEFLANMSHEIRTPMNAVLGFTDLLSRTVLAPEQREYLDHLDHSARLLLRLLDDILDHAKLEAGKVTLEAHPFAIADLVAQQRVLFDVAAREKRLALSFRVDDALPEGLLGDALRLGQILTNLIGNAIKFTDRGEVALEIRQLARDGDQCRLCLSVRDSGIGMSEAQQRHLFEAFRQADSSTTRRYGGTGLGLAISRRLVEAMKGSLTLDSRPGEGSCFTVELSLPVADAATTVTQAGAPGTAPLHLRGRRVLIAEDNPVNRKLTCHLLGELGVEARVVENGCQALNALEDATVDLVLMDLQMPEMDGFEAARRIRQRYPALPIIALSAAVLEEERRRAREAGMNDHVAKPIDRARLAETLGRWMPVAVPPPSPAPSLPPEEERLAELEGFDMDQGLASAGGDPTLYREVLALFLEQLMTRYAELPTDLAAGQMEADALHSLRGSADSVGAIAIATAAAELERRHKTGQRLEPADIERLARAMAEARSQLSQLSDGHLAG